MQRVAVKKMLAGWERAYPGRTESIFSALRHVELGHLADPRHFDFGALEAQRLPTPPVSGAPAHITAMTMVEEDTLIEAGAANS
jgi:tRNA 2-thiocytidine biosynthesis protein TtcA